MRRTVLVPRDRRAEARLLQEDRVVVGHEIGPGEGLGDAEHAGVGGEAKGRVHRLVETQQQEDRLLRRAARGGGLLHPHRVAPVEQRGAAPGIRERLGPEAVGLLLSERPTLAVDGGALGGRRSREHLGQVPAELRELVLVDGALEDVEADPFVDFDDLGSQTSVGVETQRAPVAEGPGARGPGFEVRLHRGLRGVGVVRFGVCVGAHARLLVAARGPG